MHPPHRPRPAATQVRPSILDKLLANARLAVLGCHEHSLESPEGVRILPKSFSVTKGLGLG